MEKTMITGLLLCGTLLFSVAKNHPEKPVEANFSDSKQILSAVEKTSPSTIVQPFDMVAPKTEKIKPVLKSVKTMPILGVKPIVLNKTAADANAFKLLGTVKLLTASGFVDTVPTMGSPDVPPNAQPGHCYAKCQLPNGTFAEWLEVLCDEKVVADFVKSLVAKLKTDGSIAASVETEVVTKEVKNGVVAYQRKHKLPVGNLNMATIEHMGLKID